jgi:DNA (cytosine-5)-methyltransferase 1
MPQNYTYIDLFAGCGGLSLGLHNAGWKGLFAIEKSPDAFETLKYNLIENKQHFQWPDWLPKTNHDINGVLSDFQEELKALRGQVDLVVGGPPCQGFSTAGLRKENDIRNGLIRSYLRFIMYVRPKTIFFENVKGFTLEFKKNKSKGKAYSAYVERVLNFLGYDVKGKMVDFSKFGLPQKRTRFILVGVRKDVAISLDVDTNSFFKSINKKKKSFLKKKNLPYSNTLSNAISDLVQENGIVPCLDRTNKFYSGLYSEATSKYQRFLREGINDIIPDSHSFPNHTPAVERKFIEIHREQTPNKNLNAILRKRLKINKNTIILLDGNKPAPTITTLPDDYIHYSEPRILTVREYARIQSFPDWYEFKGKYTTGGKARTKETPRYTQIGNAIPPLFGEQSGLVLKKLIKR